MTTDQRHHATPLPKAPAADKHVGPRQRSQFIIEASELMLPIGVSEAKLAAVLMRDRGPGYVDCHIAASALLGQITLVTYTPKDYERTGVKLFDTSEWDPQMH